MEHKNIYSFIIFIVFLLKQSKSLNNKNENFIESQIKNSSFIENNKESNNKEYQSEESRSSLSLMNIQIDIWNNRFIDGFSSIIFDNKNSGFIHELNNNSEIEIYNQKYMITSNNMPLYESLIIYYDDIYIEFDNENMNESIQIKKNIFIVNNDTENEILIYSNKNSNEFACMGILNGTEIWSQEFCQLIESSEFKLYCNCRGSYIYSIIQLPKNNRILKIENEFLFPNINNNQSPIGNLNDIYKNRVSRNDDPKLNHGDNVPFPPLHKNNAKKIDDNLKMNNNHYHLNNNNNEFDFVNENQLFQYYVNNSKSKFVRSNYPENINNINNKINESNNNNIINHGIEINKFISNYSHITSIPIYNKDYINDNMINNYTQNYNNNYNNYSEKKYHYQINNDDLNDLKVDSITINMKIFNITVNFNLQSSKQNFVNNFIINLSKLLNINVNQIKILKIWNEKENNSLRKSFQNSITLTINIKTNDINNIISKIKNLSSYVNDFNKKYNYKLISIGKNIGMKSISNEIIKEDSNKIQLPKNINESLHNLPVVFTMELKTKKSFVNQRDVFNSLENELSKSLNISKTLIDIPEFTYKQINDIITKEIFLLIRTEIWVHPFKSTRDEYSNLLSKIYSNIIHNKNSSFSKLFICIKYEIKQIPRVKLQYDINDNNETDSDQNYNKTINNELKNNIDENLVDEGRISKIGRIYIFDQEKSENISQDHINKTEDQDNNIEPIVYLLE